MKRYFRFWACTAALFAVTGCAEVSELASDDADVDGRYDAQNVENAGDASEGADHDMSFEGDADVPVEVDAEICGDVEICDGVDNNCDGNIDEGFILLGSPCSIGHGACGSEGVWVCADDGEGERCDAAPGQIRVESCNGIDDDCDGQVDERDDGSPLTTPCGEGCGGLQTCNGGDWGACLGQAEPRPEVCNGADDDCNGVVDDVPGLGDACSVGVGMCEAHGVDLCGANGMLCSAEVGLPSIERCDGLDDDCNGQIDDVAGVGAACEVGVGACRALGLQACIGGGLACDAAALVPAAELCNGIDDNCDGTVDNVPGLNEVCSVGIGACQRSGQNICGGGGVVCDVQPGVGSVEVCDQVDNDCNGVVDDGNVCNPCGDGALGAGEACDDGNLVNGDGCDAECTDEQFMIVKGFVTKPGGFAAGAADQFTFTVDAASRLTVSTDDGGAGCPGDTRIRVKTLQGALLGSDEDSGAGACSRLSINIPVAGTYIVEVRGAARLPSYSLDFLLTRSAVVGGRYVGSFAQGGDDQYDLSLRTNDRHLLWVNDGGTGCPADLRIYVYNSAGALVANNDDFGPAGTAPQTGAVTNSLCPHLLVQLAPGNYRVEVNGFGGRAVDAYTFVADPAPTSMPPGIARDVHQYIVEMLGWRRCYRGPYGEAGTALATILAGCVGSQMILACGSTETGRLSLLAGGARTEVVRDVGDASGAVHESNGVGWYYSAGASWGFAPAGQAVSRNSCDTVRPGTDRMCWHTSDGNIMSGYRCGDNNLNGNAAWHRVVYVR